MFVSQGKKKNFKLLLKYDSFDVLSLSKMIVLASKIYPDQALEIAKLVNKSYKSSTYVNYNSELNDALKALGL